MRAAYALLGLCIILVFGGAYYFLESQEPAEIPNIPDTMLTIESPAFAPGGDIPSKYTCDAEGVQPPLHISGIPQGTVSLVLFMDDPDIPQSIKEQRGIEKFDHWTMFDIPVSGDTLDIAEGVEPKGTKGANGTGATEYRGPCPPDREHRYFFKLYALDRMLGLSEGASQEDIRRAMEGHVLESAELIGLYERTATSTP